MKLHICRLSQLIIFSLSLTLNNLALAASPIKTLQDFQATFDVRILGFVVGEATQTLTCQSQDCELVSEAIPPSWARRFINEEAIEKIHLSQADATIKLLEYKKYLTRHYDHDTVKKTFTIQRNEDKQQFQYLEEQKSWPLQPLAFDSISLAYAIQYQVKNQRPLTDLYLQDDKIQQKIHFKETYQNDELDLDFADDELTAQRFSFSNDKIDAKLWLLPDFDYFPGKIEIRNKEENRTIILELNQPPKFR